MISSLVKQYSITIWYTSIISFFLCENLLYYLVVVNLYVSHEQFLLNIFFVIFQILTAFIFIFNNSLINQYLYCSPHNLLLKGGAWYSSTPFIKLGYAINSSSVSYADNVCLFCFLVGIWSLEGIFLYTIDNGGLFSSMSVIFSLEGIFWIV